MSDDLSPPDLDDYEEFVEHRFDGILARLELVEEEFVVLERLASQLEEIAEEDPTKGTGHLPPDSDTVDRIRESIDDISETAGRLDRDDGETVDHTDGTGIENVDENSREESQPVNGGQDTPGDDGG